MKKLYTLTLVALFSQPLSAADNDSVYSWGAWAQGVKPAAGQSLKLSAPTAKQTDLSFRPNENSAFLRDVTLNARNTVDSLTPPNSNFNPQIPVITVVRSDTPTTPRDQF